MCRAGPGGAREVDEMDERPRIPPGQHPIEDLPVLHVGAVPAFDRETWDLRIEGEVRVGVVAPGCGRGGTWCRERSPPPDPIRQVPL